MCVCGVYVCGVCVCVWCVCVCVSEYVVCACGMYVVCVCEYVWLCPGLRASGSRVQAQLRQFSI